MVTDRDITVRGVALGCDPPTATVRDVMTHEVIQCYEDEPVEEAATDADAAGPAHLGRQSRGTLGGILSLADLAADGEIRNQQGESSRTSTEPAMPRR